MPLTTLLTINGIWTATFGHVNPTLDTAVVQGSHNPQENKDIERLWRNKSRLKVKTEI